MLFYNNKSKVTPNDKQELFEELRKSVAPTSCALNLVAIMSIYDIVLANRFLSKDELGFIQLLR